MQILKGMIRASAAIQRKVCSELIAYHTILKCSMQCYRHATDMKVSVPHQQKSSSSQYHPSTPDQGLLRHPLYCTWSTAGKLNIKAKMTLLSCRKWIRRKLHNLRRWRKSTIPLLRWEGLREVRMSMNVAQSVPFLFSPASYKAYRQNQRSKDMHIQWPTTYTQYTFNYPGIFVSQGLIHSPVFTSGTL